MQRASEAVDFRAYIANKSVDDRIKASRDETLGIVRTDIRHLDKRVDGLYNGIRDVNESLGTELKEVRESLGGELKELRKEVLGEIGKTNLRIDALAEQTTQRFDAVFVQMNSMKTWGIGLGVIIFLSIVGLAVPLVISLLR